MEQTKKPVPQYYYSEKEWDRLGCGPLPKERNSFKIIEAHVKGNPLIDNNVIKRHN